MEFKDRLKDLRMAKGLSQYELADILTKINKYNVTRGSIAMWETGKRVPQLETVQCIADYFGVSYDYLMGKDATTTVEEVTSWDKDAILKWAETAELDDVKAVLRALMDRL